MHRWNNCYFAELHDLPERTVRNWCNAGKMEGAVLVGKTRQIDFTYNSNHIEGSHKALLDYLTPYS